MKVNITIDLSNFAREALDYHFGLGVGRGEKPSHKECKDMLLSIIEGSLDEYMDDYDKHLDAMHEQMQQVG